MSYQSITKAEPFVRNSKADYTESEMLESMDESIQDKSQAKKRLAQLKIRYQVLFIATIVFLLIVSGLAGVYVYNLYAHIDEIKKQKDKAETLYNDQKERIAQLEDQIKSQNEKIKQLKEELAKKTSSESSLTKSVNKLSKENESLKDNLTQTQKDNKGKIEKLQTENKELKKELGKDYQKELDKESKGRVSYFDKFTYNILCPKCPQYVPLLQFLEEDGKIKVNAKCPECDYNETFEINEFISKMKETSQSNTHHCQKADRSHSNRKAEFYYMGNYFCDECAENLKKLVNPSELKRIEEGVIYSEEKYKYYCPICQKHYIDLLVASEHNKEHNVINLEEHNKSLKLDDHEKEINQLDTYLKTDITNTKSVLYQALPEILYEINRKLLNYQGKINALIYLGKVIQYNYEKNKSYPNYYIIQNMVNFANSVIKNLKIKDLKAYSELNVNNIGNLFNSLEEKLIN